MKHLTTALLAVVALGLSAAAGAAQPLLTTDELDHVAANDHVRIIDIRSADAYAADHIPGAVSAPYPSWRGPSDNPGKLPDKAELTALVRGLGLTADSHAVVVGTGKNSTAFGAAARVYWTLKYVGLTDLSILNGGYKAWADAGKPVDQATPDVAASDYDIRFDDNIIATTSDVAAQVGNSQTRLVDARPHKFYEGKTKAPTARIPGTIKGAVNVENAKFFQPGTATFVSPTKARQIAQQSLDGQADETISFCNTGHWAATDWFALSEVAGVKNVRLYPTSLAEWTQNPDRPMQNVPGRGEQLLNKIKSVFN